MRLRVVVFEVLTAAWYLYLVLCSRIEAELYSIVTILDRVLITAGALIVAWAIWKHRRWSAKAAVILAAVVGLPTLESTIGRLEPIVLASDTAAHAIQWIAYPAILLCQLAAFFEGLRQLRSPDAAA